MTKETMHIGIDDTDSTRKGCTTYIAALLVERLLKLGVAFTQYPALVRLNPNVPWKTRGNGALCLRIEYNETSGPKIKETVISTVEQCGDLECKETNPGIVFLNATRIPRDIQTFSKATITGITKLNEATKLLKKHGGEALAFKTGRGIIGALAAVGETFWSDHTFEVIAYRTPENCGTKRRVDEASIFKMDNATKPFTFNNVDVEKKRIIITPRGPDPILFGIRGETAAIVKKAFLMVRSFEPIERWVIFCTNQGTDAHLTRIRALSQLKTYGSVIATGTVSANPRMIRGRHVVFSIRDATSEVDCVAYEPTGFLRTVATKLIPADQLEVHGAVRPPSKNRPLTINLEKIRLMKLTPIVVYHNPICPKCGARLKSMGTNKGFRCEKCGSRHPRLTKVAARMKRDATTGLYMTSTRSQRHLTKPSARYGMEKHRCMLEGFIGEWHFP